MSAAPIRDLTDTVALPSVAPGPDGAVTAAVEHLAALAPPRAGGT